MSIMFLIAQVRPKSIPDKKTHLTHNQREVADRLILMLDIEDCDQASVEACVLRQDLTDLMQAYGFTREYAVNLGLIEFAKGREVEF